MNDHPPIGTPLSAFTPEMLERLPMCSVFGEGERSFGNASKTPQGWHFTDGEVTMPTLDDADETRPLIRVGPEQAAEPVTSADHGPLPDPWPGYLVDFDELAPGVGRRREIISAVRVDDETGDTRYFIAKYCGQTPWTIERVHEVRTATGEVLWRRA